MNSIQTTGTAGIPDSSEASKMLNLKQTYLKETKQIITEDTTKDLTKFLDCSPEELDFKLKLIWFNVPHAQKEQLKCLILEAEMNMYNGINAAMKLHKQENKE